VAAPDIDEVLALASRDSDGALIVLEEARQAGTATPNHLYVHAQLLSRVGRHEEALALIDAAVAAFRDVGDELGAARCDAGRSNVLEDLGRHVEAVEAARRWLGWLEDHSDTSSGHRLLLVAQARANLGVRLEDAGDYLGALAAHDAAIVSMLGAGDEETAASMQINRANVLNLLGRSPEAFTALQWSAEVLEHAGNIDDLGVVAINAGESLCRMGRPDEGLHWFARAEQLVGERSSERAVLLVETADALAALGALEEAARRFGDAFDVLASMPLAWLEVRAWTGLGRVAGALGRTVEAAEAFAEASVRHLAAGNLPGWAITESEALVLLPADTPGRRTRIANLVDAIDDLDEEAWPVQACQVHLNVADLITDNQDESERHLRIAVRLAERSGVPHLFVRAGQRLAEFLWRDEQSDDAERVLAEVLGAAERVRARLHADELLRTFPVTVEAAHNLLVDVRLTQARIGDALVLADAGRARAMVELGPHLQANGTGSVGDTDAELGAIYDRLLTRDSSMTAELRRQLDERATRLEARRERLDLTSAVSSRRQVPEGLPPVPDGELQVLYHVADGHVGMFTRHGNETRFHAAIADLGAVADDLAAFHSVGRRAVAMAGRPGDIVARLTTVSGRLLQQLGTGLLGRVGERLDQVRRLTVIPHRSLHGVPFHALVVDGRAVFDQVEVTVAPSLTIRANRPAARTGPTLLVGSGGRDLPGVDTELDALHALMPDAVVLRDAEATVATVLAAMRGAGCIHLASHGIFRQNAPMASGIRLADGWLTARQTATLDLTGAKIVLSACDTGRSVVHAGDELLGLQRGFLLAGAHAVVMTHWPAVDEAAVTTTIEFHRHHRSGLAVPAALRAAWTATRHHHPHPWWWAPFFAIAP
jgi:tetratricopeptide (TPR) repeat protein